MSPHLPINLRRLRWAAALIMAAAIGAALLWAQFQVRQLFAALAPCAPLVTAAASAAARTSDLGGLAATAAEPGACAATLSPAITLELRLWFGHWPLSADGQAEWLAFNLRYLRQLGGTLALVLPVGALVAACAFLSAALLFLMQRAGWGRLASSLDAALDAVPYALWMLPALSLAYYLWSADLGFVWPYWAYLAVILFGFGAFLLPFFIHADLKRLRMLERCGVLDAERVTGAAPVAMFVRVWRFDLRRLFVHQWLYCTLFVMLLEFSAFSIVAFNQPRQDYTIFTQANLYHEAAKAAARRSRGDRDLDFAEGARLLSRLLPPATTDPGPAAVPGPAALFDPAAAAALRGRLEARGAGLDARQRDALWESLQVRPADQEALFFHTAARFYFACNTALILGLFAALLIGFDLYDYAEDGHG